jgi:hypothetical protein
MHTFLNKLVAIITASGLELRSSEPKISPIFLASADELLIHSRMLKLAQSILCPSDKNYANYKEIEDLHKRVLVELGLLHQDLEI